MNILCLSSLSETVDITSRQSLLYFVIFLHLIILKKEMVRSRDIINCGNNSKTTKGIIYHQIPCYPKGSGVSERNFPGCHPQNSLK
jgi:hypothetical protein